MLRAGVFTGNVNIVPYPSQQEVVLQDFSGVFGALTGTLKQTAAFAAAKEGLKGCSLDRTHEEEGREVPEALFGALLPGLLPALRGKNEGRER